MARSSDSPILLSLLRDKTFQAREIRRVIMLSLIYLAVTTGLVGVFYHQMLGSLLEGMAPLLFVSEDIAMGNEALPALGAVLGRWMLIMLGINMVITIALAIYISRKLGHPIMAIKRALREIGNGNLDVRLRNSDNGEFGEIVSELHSAMHSVRTQIGAAKESMAQMDPTSTSRDDDTDSALVSCKSALDFFQIDNTQNELSVMDDDSTNRAA